MIIGFVGFIGAGKGTAADYLVREHGFIKESFANSVKDSVSVIFGWDRKMLEGATPESRLWREQPDPWWSNNLNRPFSPRLALQLMGTEAGRNVFDDKLRIYSTFKRMTPWNNYVIADVRFQNEIEEIKKNGGIIIRVKKGSNPIWFDTAYKQNTTPDDQLWILQENGELMEQKYPEVHYSEWAWVGSQDIDYVILNNNTIEKLEEEMEKLLPLCGIAYYNSGS